MLNRRPNSNANASDEANTEAIPFLSQVVIESQRVNGSNDNNNNNNNNNSNDNKEQDEKLNNDNNVPAAANANANILNNRAARLLQQGTSQVVLDFDSNQVNFMASLMMSCMFGSLCTCSFLLIFVQIMALYIEFNNKCDSHLQQWLVIHMLLPLIFVLVKLLFSLPFVCFPNLNLWFYNQRLISALFNAKILSNCQMFWFMIGIVRFFWKSSECSKTAPVIYFTVLLTIIAFFYESFVVVLFRGMRQVFGTWIRNQFISNEMFEQLQGLNPRNANDVQTALNRLLHGLPPSVINSLPTRTYNNNNNNNSNENDKFSSLCFAFVFGFILFI